MKEKWMGIGAVVSAALASVCCLGPLVLVALGLGGVGLAAGMAPYRPFFLGLTAVFLGFAFYRTYRKRETACADGRCELRSGSKTMKAALWAVTVAAAGLAAFPQLPGFLFSGQRVTASADLQTVGLKISGMHCAACATSIEKSLKQVPGVKAASVDFDGGEAVVQLRPGSVPAEDMVKAVQAAGPYTAEIQN
ncbi:MAG: cation transporter [Elusimicrobia bacterium]|nr:cation transporter [Elusimicrobiota bacterium]